MGKLFLLFTVVPLLEIFLLARITAHIGFFATVALVLLTGIVGAAMARAEGLRVLRSWQESLAAGRMPEEGVISGLLVLVGGVLLVTPGVFTDAVGFALLLPATRGWVGRILAARLARAIEEGRVQVSGGVASSVPPFDVYPRPPNGPGGARPRSPGSSRAAEPAPPGVIDVEGESVDPRE